MGKTLINKDETIHALAIAKRSIQVMRYYHRGDAFGLQVDPRPAKQTPLLALERITQKQIHVPVCSNAY